MWLKSFVGQKPSKMVVEAGWQGAFPSQFLVFSVLCRVSFLTGLIRKSDPAKSHKAIPAIFVASVKHTQTHPHPHPHPHSRIYTDTHKHTETHRDAQRHTETHRDT